MSHKHDTRTIPTTTSKCAVCEYRELRRYREMNESIAILRTAGKIMLPFYALLIIWLTVLVVRFAMG